MEKYSLVPDEGDNRLIRCSNCLQILACVASIINCIVDCGEEGDKCVQILDCIADTVFCIVSGCMLAQTNNEINVREKAMAPTSEEMER